VRSKTSGHPSVKSRSSLTFSVPESPPTGGVSVVRVEALIPSTASPLFAAPGLVVEYSGSKWIVLYN
jgi:hypothetical protein